MRFIKSGTPTDAAIMPNPCHLRLLPLLTEPLPPHLAPGHIGLNILVLERLPFMPAPSILTPPLCVFMDSGRFMLNLLGMFLASYVFFWYISK